MLGHECINVYLSGCMPVHMLTIMLLNWNRKQELSENLLNTVLGFLLVSL